MTAMELYNAFSDEFRRMQDGVDESQDILVKITDRKVMVEKITAKENGLERDTYEVFKCEEKK